MKKKNMFDNVGECVEIVEKIAEYDKGSALAIICLAVDTIARDTIETAPELAKMILKNVEKVNEELGAF